MEDTLIILSLEPWKRSHEMQTRNLWSFLEVESSLNEGGDGDGILMIRGHFGLNLIQKSQLLFSLLARQRFASGNGVATLSSCRRGVESLKLDQSLLALLSWAGLGTEDRTQFATHLGYALEDLGTTHPRTKVSTEVSEVVVDKVHVSAVRKVKMSALIDPLDNSEVPAAGSGQIEEWYRNYKVIKLGHPLPDKELTPDQLVAMHTSRSLLFAVVGSICLICCPQSHLVFGVVACLRRTDWEGLLVL